jgi:hypothetical protein
MKRDIDCCPKFQFDCQVCQAISELASKHGLVVRGSVLPDLKGAYRIWFSASPKGKKSHKAHNK